MALTKVSVPLLLLDNTRIVRTVYTEEDVEALQADLDKVYCWQESNTMELTSKKFEMRYGEKNTFEGFHLLLYFKFGLYH